MNTSERNFIIVLLIIIILLSGILIYKVKKTPKYEKNYTMKFIQNIQIC